jgi:hypothetical protein
MRTVLCMCVLSNALQSVKAALPFMTVFNIWHSNSMSRGHKLKVHAAVLRVVEPFWPYADISEEHAPSNFSPKTTHHHEDLRGCLKTKL